MPEALKRLRESWLAISLTALAVLLLASAMGGTRGLGETWRLESQLAEINEESFLRMQEIRSLRDQITRIDTDDEALAHAARRRLHLVLPGETLYRIPTAEAAH